MSRANLVHDFSESSGSRGEEWAAVVSAKTQILVKLVSPGEACEGCEVHERENTTGAFYDARSDLNESTNCRWWDFAASGVWLLCRLDLKESTNCRWWDS
jgi:hypothetical protein